MEGKYRYRDDLLALQACKPEIPKTVPPSLSVIQSPLSERLEEWRKALQGHPDKLFYQYILVGIERGFRIGLTIHSSVKRLVITWLQLWKILKWYRSIFRKRRTWVG